MSYLVIMTEDTFLQWRNNMYNILLVDDDKDIRNALKIYLTHDDYRILEAENGKKAVNALHENEIHLILLDVMMPIMDGIEVAQKIRTFSNVPILFLSAKSEDTDKLLGLNVGGDDYITKPFNPIELTARVKSALRRFTSLGGIEDTVHDKNLSPNIYQTGALVLDDNKKQVSIDDKLVQLTAVEYNILKFLMENLDFVFSSKQIYEAVWQEPAFDVSKTISVHIRHIREKIEINPKEPHYLKVVYGLGYKVVKL